MKRIVFAKVVALFLSSLTIVALAEEENADAHIVETEHLMFYWQEGAVSDEGLEMAQTMGEQFYAAIRDLLGYDPKAKIVIVMEGNAQRADGSWGYPHVDSWRRIHLYRFGPTPDTYFSALAHEMVHVFRFHRRPHHDWFLEEGFAEFVALRVDPSLQGFPWYDTPIAVVAGQWIANEEDIPLQLLRDNHRALNLPCKAQSYALRSAYFDYLGKTYGDDKVLELAGQERAGALPDYEKFFDKDFDALADEWRESLLAEYNEVDGVDKLSRRYREESPIKYMPVCQKGEQF